MFRGSYTAGSVAFLLLSTTLPAFCLRIFPRNARKRRGGRIALAPASCIQNRPGFHCGNRGGSFALGALFQALTQNLARGLLVSPAYAGKSFTRQGSLTLDPDHPRVCGEKVVYSVCKEIAPGSPPRVRGKGHLTLAVSHMHRINPAYAGKRSRCSWGCTHSGDPPRVCGEKSCSRSIIMRRKGSPPRTRGKD